MAITIIYIDVLPQVRRPWNYGKVVTHLSEDTVSTLISLRILPEFAGVEIQSARLRLRTPFYHSNVRGLIVDH